CWEALARLDVIDGMGGSGIRETYRVLCTPVVTALRSLGIDAFHAGVCDISCTDGPDRLVYKLAGTAQLRRRTMALVHGSLLVTADVAELGRYLKQPSEEPDYRAGRGHDDFCRTVAEMIGAGTDKDGYQNRNGYGHRNGTANGRESGDENGGESDNGHGFMDNAVLSRMVTAIDATARTLGFETVSPPSSLTQAATKLAEGKYRNDEWNWRRIRPKEARDRP
ncbi:MAG: hypothetical protein LUG50_13000, partial [Planctomycetaceae bacterium]|nr:hypothetical protein [Planctomycetaceae bacterium]